MEPLALRSTPWNAAAGHCSNHRRRRAAVDLSSAHVFAVPVYRPRCPNVVKIGILQLRPLPALESSRVRISASSSAAAEVSEKDVAFVAGATGKVGSRAVRELLKLGFRVRAGVRSPQKAETLVESVRKISLNDTGASDQPIEKLEIVQCDLENEGNILPAIANASVVLCCIGASEKEIFDITGPYRIDYKATENLIKAATTAKVDHFILLTSLGTNKIGFPAAILNLFWGVLIWKRKAEEALINSGLPYTIVRPGGMERPTDSYKETYNLVLAEEDTLFGGQVSNLQVAELMAFMAKNPKLSYCKIVEVIAETTAPLLPMETLLAKIPTKRDPPPEFFKDPATPVIDSKPSKPSAEDDSSKPKVQSRPQSPYAMYEDLKPPTSPTPTQSTTPGTINEKHVGFAENKSPVAEISSPKVTEEVNSEEIDKTTTQNSRPLSPYAAYEDLKPPTSPTPSLPKY